MSEAKPFFDTNVALYLLSTDTRKADRAEALLADGGAISVQIFAARFIPKICSTGKSFREL